MSDPVIRPYQKDDVADLVVIEQQVQYSPWNEIMFQSPLEYERYQGFCLELNQELQGFYLIEQILDEATLHNIAVAPQSQGHSYGKLLLKHAISAARQGGAAQLFLEVRKSNLIAQQLYSSNGFEQVGARKGYYSAPWGREDGVVMLMTL